MKSVLTLFGAVVALVSCAASAAPGSDASAHVVRNLASQAIMANILATSDDDSAVNKAFDQNVAFLEQNSLCEDSVNIILETIKGSVTFRDRRIVVRNDSVPAVFNITRDSGRASQGDDYVISMVDAIDRKLHWDSTGERIGITTSLSSSSRFGIRSLNKGEDRVIVIKQGDRCVSFDDSGVSLIRSYDACDQFRFRKVAPLAWSNPATTQDQCAGKQLEKMTDKIAKLVEKAAIALASDDPAWTEEGIFDNIKNAVVDGWNKTVQTAKKIAQGVEYSWAHRNDPDPPYVDPLPLI